MIKAIIFDLGDVLLNLEMSRAKFAFQAIDFWGLDEELVQSNKDFEIGAISEETFLKNYQKRVPDASLEQIKKAYNTIIGDFPRKRLAFLKKLGKRVPLFLLSNTDSIHIEHLKSKVSKRFYADFENCFQKIYFSFEVGLRKPDEAIFRKVIIDQNLVPHETLFVDDRIDNIEAAQVLGLQTWHIDLTVQDVVELEKIFEIKDNLNQKNE
jgi:putative hydrolase of the HAD superfamily